mmetsp:Transcript_7445/g.10235  ORF Transcript_7445/g.10235 Transcript_7445/m.10235 type:complete len:108 (+) Transcript_7445:208-531(+)
MPRKRLSMRRTRTSLYEASSLATLQPTWDSAHTPHYGAWAREALEAHVCAQSLDAQQAQRAMGAKAICRSAQASRVLASHHHAEEQAQICIDVSRVQDDCHAAPDQG